jgi:isopentenyl-diphosphate delta-isomerase type 1
MNPVREAHLVELVDAAGRGIGACRVDEAHQAPGRLHRAFSVLLVDPDGRMLLQQRAAAKTRFPLSWANACCGHPAPGRPVADAANARLREELGIGPVPLAEIGVYVYQARDPVTGRVEFEYDHVLLGELSPDVPLRPDPGEVADVRWVTRDELDARLQRRPAEHAPWLGGVANRMFQPGAGAVDPSDGRVGDEALSAGAVARHLGVAVTTLRSWHQRYGLGPSRHVPGQHRRYTAKDLSRLEIMRRLTDRGVAPAEAARWARRAPGQDGFTPSGARAGGGAIIPVGRTGPEARGLARAAMRLDPVAMREIIESGVEERGVVDTWEEVVRPVLHGIGERHAATSALIEVEHLISRALSQVFGALARPRAGAPPPRILLACADEEQHSLPIEALAAALAQAGATCRMLGARVPPAALLDAVTRTGPVAVLIWSHSPDTGNPAQLTALLALPRWPVLVLAGGPGWPADELPEGIGRPESLAQAVSLLITAAETGGPGGR